MAELDEHEGSASLTSPSTTTVDDSLIVLVTERSELFNLTDSNYSFGSGTLTFVVSGTFVSVVESNLRLSLQTPLPAKKTRRCIRDHNPKL